MVAARAAAVGTGDGGAARLRVPRYRLVLGRAAHRDRVDVVRVAITVTGILVAPAVARRPHED